MVKSKPSMTESRAGKQESEPNGPWLIGNVVPSKGFSTRAQYESAVKSFTTQSRWFRHPDGPYEEERAERLDAALDSQSCPYKIFRGVAVQDADFVLMRPGAVIDMNGIASWSTSADVARNFAYDNQESFGGVRVVFVMDGTAHGADISGISTKPYEKEVATSSGSRQVVEKVIGSPSSDYVTIVVKEL